ncbi:MAG: bifunctional glycosyltransferase family 2/GtrA family protein [Clostridia bacterium]|nr:bifunctional glycosyltransferase family 2/GtrA family protein [Clostridia bacterium]
MKTALIIPAYKPGKEMLELLEQFRGSEEFIPVVVDDGSGADFRPIFDAVPDFATLLRHEVNRGKGAALKTAISHVLKNMPECALALTADADGQHRYDDILKVNETAKANPGALVLGSRKFEGDVPFRSRFGNGFTRQVFALASGKRIYDTQTGLRVFDRAAMERFVKLSGDRYEYEINMLLDAAQSGMQVIEETIATVYLNDNESSHFDTLRDSWKIYKCIFRFAKGSLLSFVIDFVLVILLGLLAAKLPEKAWLAVSVVGARVITVGLSFIYSRRTIFKANESAGKSVLRHLLISLLLLAINLVMMYALAVMLNWPLVCAKLLVEFVIFIARFMLQGRILTLIKFGGSSFIGFLVDYAMVLLLNMLTKSLAPAVSLAISVVGARLVSASVNFTINHKVVFKGDESLGKAVLKYAALALFILAANYGLMHVTTIGLNWPLAFAKILVETVLFFVSYIVQGKFVYRKK